MIGSISNGADFMVELFFVFSYKLDTVDWGFFPEAFHSSRI